MAAKVTITNILTKVIADGKETYAVISPTGIPTPKTPVEEYESDMITITDGTLFIPAYDRFQQLSIPYGAKTEFNVDNAREINYWENIKVAGAKIEVVNDEGYGIELQEEFKYTYNPVTFSGKGTEQDPYKPTFAANTFYKVEENEYVVLSEQPDDWGKAADKYFTRTENKLPTNDVTGE